MWTINPSELFQRRQKRWAKKHLRELSATLDNLDTYLEHLHAGEPPQLIQLGFIHHEPEGVKAIDQKGGGPNLAQTRLYTFPDENTHTLHLITIGDKHSQKADLKDCKVYMRQLKQTH
jgi:hypothetical protein